MKVNSLDHLVLTVQDIETTCRFYRQALGMEVVSFGTGRKALAFGAQKINLQQAGKESTLKAEKPTPGSADAARSLRPRDRQRVLRALEVVVVSGHTLAWWREHARESPLAAEWRALH